MELTRRGLITGVGALIVAPAIVRASSIMPVRSHADGPAVEQVWIQYQVEFDPETGITKMRAKEADNAPYTNWREINYRHGSVLP